MSNNSNARLVRNGQVVPRNDDQSEANKLRGLDLRDSLSWFVIPPVESTERTADSFADAVIATEDASAGSDTDNRIKRLTEKAKGWTDEALAILEHNVIEPIVEFGLTLVTHSDETGKPLSTRSYNDDGVEVIMPVSIAIRGSIRHLLFSMARESNRAFLETKSTKTGKPKQTLFDDPEKGAKSKPGEGRDETIDFKTSVRHIALDRTGKLRKAIELFVKLGKAINNNDLVTAGELHRVLTGDLPCVSDDSWRFYFDPSVIRHAIQARVYGLCAVTCRNWIKELKQAKTEGKQLEQLAGEDAKRLAEYRRILESRLESIEDKPETIPGTKAPSPDTKATLPKGTARPITEETKKLQGQLRDAKIELAKVVNKHNEGTASDEELTQSQTRVASLEATVKSALGIQ